MGAVTLTDHGNHAKGKHMMIGGGSQTGSSWRGQKGQQPWNNTERVSSGGLGLGLRLFQHGKGPGGSKDSTSFGVNSQHNPTLCSVLKKKQATE